MFFILLISYSIAQSCTRLDEDYLKIVAHKNEYLYYPITNAFKDWRDFSEYELIDLNNKIQLNQPIQLLNSGIVDEIPQDFKIIKFDRVQNKERYWLNQYAILRILNNQYQLLYNVQQWHSNQDRMPKFDKSIDIGSTDLIKCFDFVWITSKSLIIDCIEIINEEESNYFYAIQIGDQILKTKLANTYPYNKNQERNLYIQNKYLYRVTKKNKYNNLNQVEIFQYNSEILELTLFTTINSQFFVDYNFTQYYEDYEKFEILDFKCSDTDQFSFLDDLQNIIYLAYHDEWTLTKDQSKFKIHSYDVDFKTKQYIGVGESFFYNSMYSDSQLNFSFDSSHYTPYMIEEFFNLVSSESLIQIQANEISFTKQGDFSQVFIDQQNNELFSIQGNTILRFLNQYGVQLIYHPIDDADFNIYKAQVNYKGCTLNIEYHTIASDSQELIQVRKDEFMFWDPFFASSISQMNYFYNLVQGPNVSIAILNEQDNISDNFYFNQPQKINVDNQSQSDYTFLEIIEYSRINTMQLLVISQNDQLQLTLKLCPYINFRYQCSIVKETQLDFQLTKENTAISCYMDFIYIVTLISSEKLSYISYHQPGYFQTDILALEKEQEIDSIGFFTFTLVLSSSKQQVVYVYALIQEMIFMYSFSSIDYEFIKPNQMFYQQQDTSKQVHLLFLFNKQDQLIVILFLDVNLYYVVNQIQLNEVENIKVLVSQNKFVVAQEKKDSKYEILVYNMENKCNIVLEKTLPLYSFVIDKLENIVLGLNLDVLYVKSQNKLLIYQLKNPSHNSLFRVISIDQDIKDIFGIKNYLVFIQKQELIIYFIFTQLYFSYNIKMNQDIFIQINQTQVQFSNDQSKLNISQKFKCINMNTQIEIYQEKFQIVTKLTNEYQNNMIQDMGSNWYSGQVIQFQLLNDNINNKVKIIQPVNETQNIFYNSSRSVKDFDETKLFVLSDRTYSLIDKTNGILIKEFQFLDQDYQCKQILYAQDQNYIVLCSQGAQDMIFGISCKNQLCQSSKGLPISSSLRKAYLYDKNLFLIGQSFLFVYGVQESVLEIEKAKFYGKIQFDSDYYSNTILKIRSNHYNLYSFNFFGMLLIKELKILDDTLIQFNQFVSNVKEYLNRDYFMNNQLVEIQVLSTNLEGELFQGKFLFFAKQGAHFGMNYNFTCKDSGCQLNNQEVFSIIQGYEDFILFEKYTPTINLQNDLLLIMYQDQRSNSKFLAVYRLPQNNQRNVPIQFFGAIEFTNQFYRIEKQLISYKLNNKEYILFNKYNYTMLTRYEVNPSPKIVYNGIMSKDYQYIQVKNYFSKQQLLFFIEIEQTEKSIIWPWILGSVIVGVICIGIGIYLFKKKKKVDTLI